MTNLDQRIDAAAQQIVAKKPSPYLRQAVMSRIHRGKESTRRPVLLVLMSSTAIACIVAAVVINTPTSQQEMTFIQARSFPQELATAPSVNVSPPVIRDVRVGGIVATGRRFPAGSTQTMQLEAISVELIEVGSIEPVATSITTIQLTDLTIEPLAASND